MRRTGPNRPGPTDGERTHEPTGAGRRERGCATGLTGSWETSKMASMKTTLDLPDDLVRAVKLRALREGRKLKEAVAELLRRGLAATPMPRPTISTDAATGLPTIQGAPVAP